MQFKIPCTVTLDLDDEAMRLLELTERRPLAPSARGAHLVGVNAARSARKRADIDAVKPKIVDLLVSCPLSTTGVLAMKGAFSRNVVYEALRELRANGEVVINGEGLCVLAAKGASDV